MSAKLCAPFPFLRKKVRIVFSVAAVDEKVIDLSLVSGFKDFEDAIQYYSALQVKADCIITRNKGDYRDDKIPVLTPEEFLATLEVVPHLQTGE